MDFVFLCRSIHGSRTTSRRRHRLRMARIRQACGTTCASTTTVPRGRSCRDSESATSMTVAIVLGGRAKLSRRTSTGEVFCLSLGLDLQSMVENSRAMIRATRVDDVFDMLCPNQKTRLSSDHLKEKHLTTRSGCRRKLCVDHKKVLTSELAAKRMKTGNQLARIDVVDTKRLRETLSKEMLAYQCAGFRTFHDLRGVFSCTEDGTCMGEPAKEKIVYLARHVGTNTAMALPIQVCGSQNTGSQTVVQTFSPHFIFFHV